MKKAAFIISVMALLFLSTLSLAESAIKAQVRFDTPIGQNGENPRVIVLEDTLYLFSRREGRILSWKIGEDAMTPFSLLPPVPAESMRMAYKEMDADKRAAMDQMVTHILAGDGRLWALNQYSGKFGSINEEGIDSTYTLDLSGLNPELNCDEDYRFPGFVSKGTLYLFSVGKRDAFFARYTLATGQRQDIALAYNGGYNGGAVYPYTGDCALYAADTQTEQSGGGYAESLYTLNLDTGALVPLAIQLPNVTVKNTTAYIKGLYPMHASNDLYCFVESGDGASSNNQMLVFDKRGLLKLKAALPRPESGFYYLCQPIDAHKVIAVDAFGAAVLAFP